MFVLFCFFRFKKIHLLIFIFLFTQSNDKFGCIDPGIRAGITSCDSKDTIVQVNTTKYRHKSKIMYAQKNVKGGIKEETL